MHCNIMSLAHVWLIFPIDHVYAEPELEEPMEQAQVEDLTNVVLNEGKPQCIPPKSLSFMFETLCIIIFDRALRLQDLYGTVAALGFFLPDYPCLPLLQ
jgi:hypothetical protein